MQDERAVFGIQEPFSDGAIELLEEGIEVGIDVQQADRFEVQSELSPRDDLAKLFEGTESAGHCNKSIGDLHHQGFPFVHGANNAQFSDVGSADFARKQCAGDYADDFPAAALHGFRNRAHETHTAAAVHETNASVEQRASERTRDVRV